MKEELPSIPFRNFDEAVFTQIIAIYSIIAGVPNPCGWRIKPRVEMAGILKDLSEHHLYCEWVLGSTLCPKSKLFLRPISAKTGLRITIDFDPNTRDDSQSDPVAMRTKFHNEVREYLDTLSNN